MFPSKKPPIANDTKSAIGFLSGAPKPPPAAAPAAPIAHAEPDADNGAQQQQDVYQTVEQLVGQFGADEVKAALDACLAKHGSDQNAAPVDTGGGMVA